jgi:hypothetical protein
MKLVTSVDQRVDALLVVAARALLQLVRVVRLGADQRLHLKPYLFIRAALEEALEVAQDGLQLDDLPLMETLSIKKDVRGVGLVAELQQLQRLLNVALR